MKEIPKEWQNCEISEFTDIVMGQSPPSTAYNDHANGIPFYQGKAEFGNIYPKPVKWCSAPKKIAEKDAVLLSVRAPVGPTNINPHRSCIGRGLAAIHPLGGMKGKFLLYLLRNYESILSGHGKGTTFKAITKDILFGIRFSLPPISEQLHILEKLEQLFSDLDNAIENLKKAQEQLKVYRQAVLKGAFEGCFSKDGLGRKAWKELTVDEIGEVITGSTPSKQETKYYGKDYPLYKPGDLDAGFMTADSVDGLTEEGIKKARMLPAKSVLVTCIGATIGKTGLIRNAGACNQQINAIVSKDFMASEYVYYYCISPQFQEQIKTNASATTLPILNKTKFQRLMFLVPSRDVQEKIVEELESRFSVCDKMEESIGDNLQKAEALRQSILKSAFEGKLTEKWRKEHKDMISGDNSAEALLQKIKAEKDKKSKLSTPLRELEVGQ